MLCKFQFLTLNIFLTPLSPILGLFSNPSKNFNRKSCRKLNVDQFFFNIITFPLKGFFHELSAKTTFWRGFCPLLQLAPRVGVETSSMLFRLLFLIHNVSFSSVRIFLRFQYKMTGLCDLSRIRPQLLVSHSLKFKFSEVTTLKHRWILFCPVADDFLWNSWNCSSLWNGGGGGVAVK